jgi:hypothetical protein
VRTYIVSLSSNQNVGLPGLNDSLTFDTSLSAFSGAAIDGNSFNTNTYSNSSNDGSFFPWKYVIQTIATNLPSITLKGPYTFIFSTSGLDSTQFGILKVLYDFGDGTGRVVSYPAGNSYNGIALIERPSDVVVTNNYYPLDLTGTTYTPSVTVINGNLINFVYNLTATFFPSSIYELGDIHLLNSLSLGVSSNELLNIYETRAPNYITHAKTLSA